MNILIFGNLDPELTISSIKESFGDYPHQLYIQVIPDMTPKDPCIANVWIDEPDLLSMLRALVISTAPVLFIHSGDLIHSIDTDALKSISNILVPKNGGEGLSGIIMPRQVIQNYIEMCKKVGLYESDEESLIRYASTISGGSEYDISLTTYSHFLPYQNELLIQKNRERKIGRAHV